MGLPIQEELKQSKPFPTLKQEVLVNLFRTSAELSHQFEMALKPYEITQTQFNVLRILRGAGKSGLYQHQIRERMVARVPDVPRLMKRMEETGYIKQERDENDRRAVLAVIARMGMNTLSRIDRAMGGINKKFLVNLSESELRQLNDLLTMAR